MFTIMAALFWEGGCLGAQAEWAVPRVKAIMVLGEGEIKRCEKAGDFFGFQIFRKILLHCFFN